MQWLDEIPEIAVVHRRIKIISANNCSTTLMATAAATQKNVRLATTQW